ncbi:uncharacterized protein [Miscanthus floridulus]|uniref:uncharacterized protein n=1 Tax=Miscanthus floridulus TaxID=154761 RepID=UPI003458009C
MEVFNRLLLWLDDHGFLTPLGVNAVRNRCSLYADDVVLFLAPVERDLQVLKGALELFGKASGLFCNLDKSVATPIVFSDQQMHMIQNTLSCRLEDFPCRYLGIPLSIFKLKRTYEQALVDAVAARIPQWKGRLLNVAGRTALARATLSAIPIHISIALCLSSWAIECIDKHRRAFIWCGEDNVGGGRCRVAWDAVCRPRDLGGLGVTDLRRTGSPSGYVGNGVSEQIQPVPGPAYRDVLRRQ